MPYQTRHFDIAEHEDDDLTPETFNARTRVFHVALIVALVCVCGLAVALSLL